MLLFIATGTVRPFRTFTNALVFSVPFNLHQKCRDVNWWGEWLGRMRAITATAYDLHRVLIRNSQIMESFQFDWHLLCADGSECRGYGTDWENVQIITQNIECDSVPLNTPNGLENRTNFPEANWNNTTSRSLSATLDLSENSWNFSVINRFMFRFWCNVMWIIWQSSADVIRFEIYLHFPLTD